MQQLTVHSQANCFVLPGNTWVNFENVAASTALKPGTYVIRIHRGTFSFWNNRDRREPFVILWLHNGLFTNLATGVETSGTFQSLNGYDDTFTLQVKETTNLYALFIDSNSGDNRGEITLSILED